MKGFNNKSDYSDFVTGARINEIIVVRFKFVDWIPVSLNLTRVFKLRVYMPVL